MLDLIWLIPALPLAGFVVLLIGGTRIGEPRAGWLATLACAGSFAVGAGVFADLWSKSEEEREVTKILWKWIPVGGLQVNVALLADPLSMTMVLFVTGIATLIHLYSIGYMHGDPRFARFFLYLNLFVFSMLCLVLGDNFLLMFLGWEGVGACSFLLISFWFERDSAATAAKKAFVANRVGDFGLMIAMFLLFATVGSLTYANVFEAAEGGGMTKTVATAAGLLLFLGACGKSAQLPLHVWLPDAMEGPAPVSALIHAATMVTAGVYLMVRVHPILAVADTSVLGVIAWVGAITALFAATIAVAQNDIKRVLAYSTISQLGYMFLAVGVGANVAAIFHMVTHAFFKALLFLGAGSVIHGMHDEQNMKRMGNLRKYMPVTAVTFIIGWLAIAGLPPFAGFWSKDEILAGAWGNDDVGGKGLFALGLITALLTAYYMSRQVFLIFFGKERFLHDVNTVGAVAGHDADATQRGHPHESPWQMWAPLAALAGLSVVGGALNLPFSKNIEFLGKWLEPVVGHHETGVSGSTKVALAAVAVLVCVLGVLAARNIWLGGRTDLQARVEPALLQDAYRVDALYSAALEKPGHRLSDALATQVDERGIDGAVNGVGKVVQWVGSWIRKLQTGYVRHYALGIAAGAVLLLAYAIARVGI